jgi:hypothetical protein
MSDEELIAGQDPNSTRDLSAGIPNIPHTHAAAEGRSQKTPALNIDEKLMDSQMQLALRNHTYVTEFIKLADQKAGLLFAMTTSLCVSIRK